ncbi:IS3 family transposase [Streptomyces sp. NPDC056638]|uniref:IS3 family transposase n=1 Tax=Streptomyces sp. NPDC056638 TaxID=3345887 RepID=UPI00369944C4
MAHEITVIHLAPRRNYGVPRVTAELRRRGRPVNHKRVERLTVVEDPAPAGRLEEGPARDVAPRGRALLKNESGTSLRGSDHRNGCARRPCHSLKQSDGRASARRSRVL